MDNVRGLVVAAPATPDRAGVDCARLAEALDDYGLEADAALAATWCVFDPGGVPAVGHAVRLGVVFPYGVLCVNRRGTLPCGRPRPSYLPFALCHEVEPVEHHNGARGAFCIEFAGADGEPLGRLGWTWRVGRVGRIRQRGERIRAAEQERDRILQTIRLALT